MFDSPYFFEFQEEIFRVARKLGWEANWVRENGDITDFIIRKTAVSTRDNQKIARELRLNEFRNRPTEITLERFLKLNDPCPVN